MSRSDRSTYRKTQRMIDQTHGGFAGKSILELITDELDRAVGRYLDAATPEDKIRLRGEVRGLARALMIFAVPTYPSIKAVEKAAVYRVKEKRHAAEQATAQEPAGE